LIEDLQAVAFLRLCFALQQRIIVSFPHGQYLIDEKGQSRKAWQIARGKRAWGKRRVWNAHLHRNLETSVLAFPVKHPDFPVPRLSGDFPARERTSPLVYPDN